MAKSKVTRSRIKRKNAFPEIKGKIVEGVELMPTENGYSIGIMFQDRTFLSFDVEPYITIFPELSDWKTHNYKPLKRWPTVGSL
ncbi:MAG TPA: hypothetical protein VGK01_05620 [Candidatus Angelobacter sp.]|jgi:hypothetical protein